MKFNWWVYHGTIDIIRKKDGEVVKTLKFSVPLIPLVAGLFLISFTGFIANAFGWL